MTGAVLRLEGIAVRAGARTLLDVPRFHLLAGQTMALIGPNGAGKTMLLHIAALLRRPDSGAVWLLEQRATAANAPALRRPLSVVFQAPLLFDREVLANAAAGLRFHGVARAEAEARAQSWLRRFGAEELARRNARGLSGGEASRVALARAFATEPALLLLDEPFAALDAPSRAALLPALREQLRETETAALLVTHDLQEAAAFSDTAALMDAGRIIALGRLPELMAHPPSRRAAELLGIENILNGEIVRRTSDGFAFALHPGGREIRITARSDDSRMVSGTATMTIPAGSIRVLRPHAMAPSGWNLLPGIVRDVRWLASGLRLVIASPAPIVALTPLDPTAAPWTAGDPVAMAFAPQAVHLLPCDD